MVGGQIVAGVTSHGLSHMTHKGLAITVDIVAEGYYAWGVSATEARSTGDKQMARYILIDNHTGYIWGDSADLNGAIFSGTDLEYARALDESIGNYGRSYTSQRRARAGQNGYHVYRADIDGSEAVPVVWDGQDQETIDAVIASSRYEGFIAAERGE